MDFVHAQVQRACVGVLEQQEDAEALCCIDSVYELEVVHGHGMHGLAREQG